MKVFLDEGAFMATRAHSTDAGLDLYAPEGFTITGKGGSFVIDTGVHVELPSKTFGKIEGKSGLNINYGIVSCGGVIDEGYTGSIKVKLYNFSRKPYAFNRGDKIAQLIVQPCEYVKLQPGKLSQDTERGDAGFGSTGR